MYLVHFMRRTKRMYWTQHAIHLHVWWIFVKHLKFLNSKLQNKIYIDLLDFFENRKDLMCVLLLLSLRSVQQLQRTVWGECSIKRGKNQNRKKPKENFWRESESLAVFDQYFVQSKVKIFLSIYLTWYSWPNNLHYLPSLYMYFLICFTSSCIYMYALYDSVIYTNSVYYNYVFNIHHIY